MSSKKIVTLSDIPDDYDPPTMSGGPWTHISLRVKNKFGELMPPTFPYNISCADSIMKYHHRAIKGDEMSLLGKTVVDLVSGFTGVVTAEHNYLHGCTRLTVQPKINDKGELPATQCFDAPQLKIIDTPAIPIGKNGPRDPGGPEKYTPTVKDTDSER